MGRLATGQAVWCRNKDTGAMQRHARITPEKGSTKRELRPLPAWIPQADVTVAKQAAKRVSELIRDPSRANLDPSRTWDQWAEETYFPVHERKGTSTVQDMRWRWSKWISPHIGSLPMGPLPRDAAITFRNRLTKATEGDKRVRAKTVMNVWSVFTSAMGRAFTDDCPGWEDVRVGPHASNPCAGIKPPVDGETREDDTRGRQWLYPREFGQLMSCGAVSLAWRRTHAIAAFTFLRPGELSELRWGDVDLDAGEIRVRRSWDAQARKARALTKTKQGLRNVPIFPPLAPLLTLMKQEANDPRALVAPLAAKANADRDAAIFTRDHLRLAKLDRQELFDGSALFLPFDFRSWRTTGATWCVLANYDTASIVLWSGHKDLSTTLGSYIKQARDLRHRHGDPHAPLPACLLGADENTPSVSGFLGSEGGHFPRQTEWVDGDSNPGPTD